ncbi:hypothetical protein TRVL_09826 [Trypanosoma vivax]|nr:hypothetical protein TRVL_09826 [Trypanosoma vivax]
MRNRARAHRLHALKYVQRAGTSWNATGTEEVTCAHGRRPCGTPRNRHPRKSSCISKPGIIKKLRHGVRHTTGQHRTSQHYQQQRATNTIRTCQRNSPQCDAARYTDYSVQCRSVTRAARRHLRNL